MVNEDIVTALQNAINHNEPLASAVQILINSGYPPNEVKEASRYIGQGALEPSQLQVRPEEQLTMPEEKGFFSKISRKFKRKPKTPKPQTPLTTQQLTGQPLQQPQQQAPQLPPAQPTAPSQPALPQSPYQSQRFLQPDQAPSYPKPFVQKTSPVTMASSRRPLARELKKIRPQKQNNKKEIVLLMLLLILIGLLVVTILFKDKILTMFS